MKRLLTMEPQSLDDMKRNAYFNADKSAIALPVEAEGDKITYYGFEINSGSAFVKL